MTSISRFIDGEWKPIPTTQNYLDRSGGTISGSLEMENGSAVHADNTCKAWVSMDSATYGSPARILDSYNVSSVQFGYQNSIGNEFTRVNFTEEFKDFSYNAVATPRQIPDSTLTATIVAFGDKFFAKGYALYRCYDLFTMSGSGIDEYLPLGCSCSFYSSGG